MSHSDCFRALGVAPDASWEEVRQAYKDLVRVWHPDRFHSDPKLRKRAEQQLQKINEAYYGLKNSLFRGHQPEPTPPPETPPAGTGPTASAHPRPRRGFVRSLWTLPLRWPAKALGLGLICLTPLAFAGLVLNALRVPTLDSILAQNSLPRPVMLMPSRFVSPFGDKSATADALSAWARGEAMDLWRAMPKIGERPSERPVETASRVSPQKDDLVPRDQPRRRATAAVAPVIPVNGTEMLWTRRSGAGELWVSNETSQDALATLVQSHTSAPLRAIYIQAKSKVCMRNIAPGLYDLLAEVGENWDATHTRFRAGRQALDRNGPFQCIDVTSAQGTSGCRYDVVLRAR